MGRVHLGSPGPFLFQLPESMRVLNLPLLASPLKPRLSPCPSLVSLA